MYRGPDGKALFSTWILGLKDLKARARILARLDQVEEGNLGETETVGEGVVELVIHVGPGYRVYIGQYGLTLVVILSGGDKSTQDKDIKQARERWKAWKGKR